MGQNEVGYLKGVLTRSETYTEARLIKRNWRMQNQIRHTANPSTLQRVHRTVETAALLHEMYRPVK